MGDLKKKSKKLEKSEIIKKLEKNDLKQVEKSESSKIMGEKESEICESIKKSEKKESTQKLEKKESTKKSEKTESEKVEKNESTQKLEKKESTKKSEKIELEKVEKNESTQKLERKELKRLNKNEDTIKLDDEKNKEFKEKSSKIKCKKRDLGLIEEEIANSDTSTYKKYKIENTTKKETQDNKNIKSNESSNMRNILIVSNLAYKETEGTISECFKKFGTVEKVQMSHSKDGKFIGKAIVTFKQNVKVEDEIIWNHKVLRIERMKNKTVNDKRIFVSHINKNLTILQIRNILKDFSVKPKDIRTRFEAETKRNNGYCHITYTNSLDAKRFEKEWPKFKAKLGQEVFYEYAHEKVTKPGRYRK